jgi:hypothetical protein
LHPSTNSPPSARELQQQQPSAIPSLIVRDRALSSLSTTSSTSSSPVKRKALPPNISPLALRYSSGEHLASTLEEPESPFIRPYSVDSPTLYEFPNRSSKAFAPATLSRHNSQR